MPFSPKGGSERTQTKTAHTGQKSESTRTFCHKDLFHYATFSPQLNHTSSQFPLPANSSHYGFYRDFEGLLTWVKLKYIFEKALCVIQGRKLCVVQISRRIIGFLTLAFCFGRRNWIWEWGKEEMRSSQNCLIRVHCNIILCRGNGACMPTCHNIWFSRMRLMFTMYRTLFSTLPNDLIVNLIELPDNRRLRRHLPNDLSTRFLM
jgi:hypothetical protein